MDTSYNDVVEVASHIAREAKYKFVEPSNVPISQMRGAAGAKQQKHFTVRINSIEERLGAAQVTDIQTGILFLVDCSENVLGLLKEAQDTCQYVVLELAGTSVLTAVIQEYH